MAKDEGQQNVPQQIRFSLECITKTEGGEDEAQSISGLARRIERR